MDDESEILRIGPRPTQIHRDSRARLVLLFHDIAQLCLTFLLGLFSRNRRPSNRRWSHCCRPRPGISSPKFDKGHGSHPDDYMPTWAYRIAVVGRFLPWLGDFRQLLGIEFSIHPFHRDVF
ncbi:hypothetical protein BDN70DRAFT_887298 [Pholiota conissans]|uniref:Uncharacterized protein n=1 Tax=Pholiota conissans TaxID=109636 RepID=A0A9P6CU18_9AGAR|nr:hypothetical protein BDN70DRAFT_887298 [Pholiota conissans]